MLFARAGFERFVSGLPAVTLHEQWDASVAKVGGKVFALVGLDDGAGIVCRVGEMTYDLLLESDPAARKAPYFAERRWLHIGPATLLSTAELEGYLREAHRLVAAGLSRKARTELGLTP